MLSPFEKKVWWATQRIPKGKITTYKIIAQRIGQPRAYRAVGNALHKNPEAPRIPCHRVVKSDGSLGGYSGGVKKKIRLLRQEGFLISGQRVLNFHKYSYRLKKA